MTTDMTNGVSAQPMTRQELEARIIARASEDDAFRRNFLADPKAMFEKHLGTKLPERVVMTAHEEDANTLHFVIPSKPAIDLEELSDEDLEKIAGGVEMVTTVAVTVTIVGSLAITATLAAGGAVSMAVSVAAKDGWK